MRVVRAIKPISAGEEITISYNQSDFLTQPVVARRSYLLKEQEFFCECCRCRAPDATRRFACQCGGHYRAAAASGRAAAPNSGDSTWEALEACGHCGHIPTASECQTHLTKEIELKEKIDQICEGFEKLQQSIETLPEESVAIKIEELKAQSVSLTCHPHHYLALALADLRMRLASWAEDSNSMICALEALAEGFAVLAPQDLSTACRFAQLGEALEEVGRLNESAAIYRKSLRMLCVLQLPLEPYPRRCARQLLRVLGKLGEQDEKHADTCALCWKSTVKAKPCTLCHKVQYCCNAHRFLHKRLHATMCKTRSS